MCKSITAKFYISPNNESYKAWWLTVMVMRYLILVNACMFFTCLLWFPLSSVFFYFCTSPKHASSWIVYSKLAQAVNARVCLCDVL